ncbi:gliding motility-associated C-terminal domain-containing protein [Massilibacteroides sp.]|uniref:T9SS type B sorting domain-containing protein n=1 Tax=Massilibacteroides sp. TaxID=2034766 RepID=UPI00260781E0|nr:gliding motility-associated C-terminal domain-containing protein [Massilibacteroides sp.]MDD4515090.1 gliding motility-associated C-terminal domain-containing protein [Massilibacteroides sp.]
MFKKRLISIGFLIILLLVSLNVCAQYTVTGGTGIPLLAEQNTNNDIDVYLVYGMSGVEISYTSASTSHQWFRYKTKALDAEPITAEQNGTTSVLRNVEEGYGYFVKESTGFTKYIWIIDYSKYQVELTNFQVSEKLSGCSGVKLEGEGNIALLHYFTPMGNQTVLDRKFELKYTTLEWAEDSYFLNSIPQTDTIQGNPFDKFLNNTPYTDTNFTLSGDLFARHFGVEQSVSSDLYTAVALLVKADTTLIMEDDRVAKSSDDGVFSAPLNIRFTAYANEPVANNFTWKIYLVEDSAQFTVNFRGSEFDYTFEKEGKYKAELTVLDRTGSCVNTDYSYDFEISKFFWDAPNVFSPGASPGINDEFKITYESIVSFKGWIFNRWGNEIFHWTNPDLGWDGKKGGKYVAPGVYFYVLEAKGSDGKTHKKTGSISILRSKTERDEIIE